MFKLRIPAQASLANLQRPTLKAVSLACALALALTFAAIAQQADTAQTPQVNPAPAQQANPEPSQEPAPAQAAQPAPPAAAQPATPQPKTAEAAGNASEAGTITEDELKQMLVGKTFYLRGGYLDDSLAFNEHGALIDRSAVGSYTLSMVEINRVTLTKHKVELEGIRYGLHFNEQLAYEDPATAFDKVRITPKKKVLKISIDRELVVKPKKEKEAKPQKNEAKGRASAVKPAPVIAASSQAPANPAPAVASPASAAPESTAAAQQTASTTGAAPAAAAAPATAAEPSDEAEAKAEMAAAPAAERPADPGSVTTTFSAAHATQTLKAALDKIFAPGLDDRLIASMPDFWRLYYQAAAAKTDYRPADPSVLRQNNVDKKARLLTTFEPESNQYAQDNGVAGMTLYHVVIGADGKPTEIVIARPIGFGLDENAVAAIRKAKFEPAMKDGKPVPVLLDLVVQFRIYSKRTSVVAPPQAADKPAEPSLPGPYSVHAPQ